MDDTEHDDIPDLFPALAPHGRPTTLLDARPGRPGPHDSSYGGPLWWPADEPWPLCTGTHAEVTPTGELAAADESGEPAPHLVAVLQLRAADVPALPFPPGRDLFQLLWCPAVHLEPDFPLPEPQIRWRDSATLGETLPGHPPVRRSQAARLPYPCVLRPETVTDFPHPADLPEEVAAAAFGADREEAEESYEELLGDRWSDKAGGYAYCAQEEFRPVCEGCGAEMGLLVQLWSQLTHRPELFAGTGIDLAVTPGISYGRHQRLAVFGCAACPERPIVHDIQ